MSPPHRLRRRRKKEDFDVGIGKEVSHESDAEVESSCIYVLLLTTRSHNGGGRFDLFTHKATAIVRLHCYSRFIFVT